MVLCAVPLVQCKYYRLPKDVKPTRYYLTMEPHLEDDLDGYWEKTSFNGTITIELEILNNTNSITLHARHLTINKDNIDIVNDDAEKISVLSTTEDRKDQTVTINTASELLQGVNYSLTINNFSGFLESGEGFFLAKYAVNSTLYRYELN